MRKFVIIVAACVLCLLCGCSRQGETTTDISKSESTTKQNETAAPQQSETYAAYCKKYPKFADFATAEDELYWVVDETLGAQNETRVCAISCKTKTESYYIFQIGNDFCRYDGYNGIYAEKGNTCTILDFDGKLYYAFEMMRYISSGGFYVSDLLLFEPGEQAKIYPLTIEDALGTVANSVSFAVNAEKHTVTVQDSVQTITVPIAVDGTTASGERFTKQIKFADIYVVQSGKKEKEFCWCYDTENNQLFIRCDAFVNFAESKMPSNCHYSEYYDCIGCVRVPVTFENGNFVLSDATFYTGEDAERFLNG